MWQPCEDNALPRQEQRLRYQAAERNTSAKRHISRIQNKELGPSPGTTPIRAAKNCRSIGRPSGSYETLALEELDDLTPEEHRGFYRTLRMIVYVHPKEAQSLEVSFYLSAHLARRSARRRHGRCAW